MRTPQQQIEDMERLRRRYEGGEATYAQLAAELGIKAPALHMRGKKLGWDAKLAMANRRLKKNKIEPRPIVVADPEILPPEQPQSPSPQVDLLIDADTQAIQGDDADVRTALIQQNRFRKDLSDKLATKANGILNTITDEEVENADLRDKVHAMDVMLRHSRLHADMSTENVAHGVGGNVSLVLDMAEKQLLHDRFGKYADG